MGIVNVTPDSFSDGGKYFSTEAAVEHGLHLVADGADILDVGGESTRPYSESVSVHEELDRVIPVISQLAARTDAPISIDTSKSVVAREALAAGAEIINDVTGLQGDAVMLDVVREHRPGICAMHMRGTPQTMQDNPEYEDVTREIYTYLESRRDDLLSLGISQSQICLDPGIGFGKTHQHNITLMSRCDDFHQLACPVLVGHSNKGFIAKLLADKNCDRTAATVGASLALAQRGIQVIRVHNVLATRDALILFEACGGIDGHVGRIA